MDSSELIQEKIALAPHTSWLVGGLADFYAEPKTPEELREVLKVAREKKWPISILSGGTNVLVSDDGVEGLVLSTAKLAGLKVEERNGRLILECGPGTTKSELLKTFLKHKLEPALFLAGIPGDVGGGVAMNAGVGEMFKPREFVEIVDAIEVMNLEGDVRRFENSDLQWSYRHCEGWRPGVITKIQISWPMEQAPDILARVKAANHTRLSKQPLDQPSCGSVFVNPPGYSSGRLVQDSGLKGFSVGGAKVSEKHANFIVNTGEAKAKDIHAVIEHVKATVLAQHNVQLKTEVVYLGRWPEIKSK